LLNNIPNSLTVIAIFDKMNMAHRKGRFFVLFDFMGNTDREN
jgi:hypothetical protein